MIMFILQSALLIAIAFLLGCVVGCLLRQWVGEPVAAAEGPSLRAAEPTKEAAISAVAATAESAVQRAEPQPERAKPVLKPKQAAKPKATATGKDDLKKIRGIGKQNEKRLNDAGIRTYAQIAAWSAGEQAEWGDKLAFPGRIEREDWVGQAKALASGGETSFSKRVKKGDVPTSR